MATKADLRNRALRRIAKLSEGQNPSAYEQQVTDQNIDQVQAYLEAEGIAYWETSDIPEGAMVGLIDCVASQIAKDFLEAERAAQYSGLWEVGLNRLRRFTATRGTERATRHRFF